MNSYMKRPAPGKTPHFVKPFLSALSQIHAGDAANRADSIAHAERALDLLPGEKTEAVSSAFARGSIGLQADHTHYFDGFALMLPMHRGIGVAVCRSTATESRLIVDGSEGVESFSRIQTETASESDTIRLFKHLLDVLRYPVQDQIDLAVASGLPSRLYPVFASSFLISAHRALERLTNKPVSDLIRIENCRLAVEAFFGRRFSPAYIRTSNIQETHSFVLVDTQSLSFVPVDVPEGERPGWGLIDTIDQPGSLDPDSRLAAVQAITERLKARKFSDIDSIRDIEHRDIDEAEKILPRKYRSTFRFLVTENRRVQQLVNAIKRNDWQLCGTILLISHEARKEEWKATTKWQNDIVDLTERFSLEGVYGASQTGESSCVLVSGQPFSIPGFLDEVRSLSADEDYPNFQTILL
ncbi:MAG: hypothetical protein E2O84_03405 [Bacteroidetes bacterium]|nr:MAG: hypothetical protein E2O84_03405 [Bacteroidota bacterium]